MASLRLIEAVAGVGRKTVYRRWAIAFALGLLSVIGLPPLSLWPVLFVTLPGLVIVLDAVVREHPRDTSTPIRRIRAAAAVGWWFGFGYFLAGLYWIGFAFLVEADKFAWLLPFAVTALPAGLALFFALGTGAAMLLWSPGIGRVFALAAAFGATEWLRGNILSGFPWNALGQALAGNDYLMQSASLVGMTGLTVIAGLVCAMPAAMVRDGQLVSGRRAAGPLAVAGGLLALMLAFGAWRLSTPEPPTQGDVRLRLVQPNIPQAEKWEGSNRQRIFQTFLNLSRRSAAGEFDGLKGITHVIWPESSLPFLMLQTPDALGAIGEMLPDDVTLITGSLRAETTPDGKLRVSDGLYTVYNDIAVLDGRGRLLSTYDKMHLVPFGEYLPAQQTLEALGLEQLTRLKGGFTPGIGPRTLAVPGLPAAVPLICYEVIFPEEITPTSGQTWLLNLTNDAWFGRSVGPYQHLLQARLRAVELGMPVVRVANTGVTAVISARGEILDSLPLETQGTIDSMLPGRTLDTLYGVYGEFFSWIVILILATGAMLLRADGRDFRF